MNIQKCVAQALGRGDISAADARELNEAFEKFRDSRRHSGGTESTQAKLAQKDLSKRLEVEAARIKRLALLRAAAKQQVDALLAKYQTSGGAAARTRALQSIERVVNGTATAKEAADLAAAGIDASMAGRINRQFNGGGARDGFADVDGVRDSTPPGAAGGRTLHRYTNTDSPVAGMPWMLFAADEAEVSTGYGKNHFTFSGPATPARTVAEAARRAGFEDEFYPLPDELVDPARIVNSAGVWDDPDAVQWIWDNVLEPNDWVAVGTQDGAIVFDPDLVRSSRDGNADADEFGGFSDAGIIEEMPKGKAVPTAVEAVASLANTSRLASSKTWATGRDLKVAMQDAVLAAARAAGIRLTAPTRARADYLVRVGITDALVALEQNPGAVGWYDIKTRQALAVAAIRHPEIMTDINARMAYTWALAVTSNGQKVDANFDLADTVYTRFKADGVMPTDVQGGKSQAAINDGLALYNELVVAWGPDTLRKFMITEFTVGEIGRVDKKLTPSGEFMTATVRGAAIIGPKIGNGFYANLNGIFSALTMDRWLVRTWGRWTGTLIEDFSAQSRVARTRLAATIAALDPAGKKKLSQIIGATVERDLSRLKAAAGKLEIRANKTGLSKDKAAFEAASAEWARLNTDANHIRRLGTSGRALDVIAAAIQKASGKAPTKAELAAMTPQQKKDKFNPTRAALDALDVDEKGEPGLTRRAGNNLAKYLDGQKEQPADGGERGEMRAVFRRILAEVRKNPTYADLPMSDLQAALWYAEKRLYEHAKADLDASGKPINGYEEDEAPDYANAAVKVARARGVDEALIQKALNDEVENGRDGRADRAGGARPADSQAAEGGVVEGQPRAPRGFTETERVAFLRQRRDGGTAAGVTAQATSVGLDVQPASRLGQLGVKRLTRAQMQIVFDQAEKMSGVVVGRTNYGRGGWVDDDTKALEYEPSSVTHIAGTPEEIDAFVDIVGYLAGQQAVLHVGPPKAGAPVEHRRVTIWMDETSTVEGQTLFELARAADPLFTAFAPYVAEGRKGISLVVENKGFDNALNRLEAALNDRHDIPGEFTLAHDDVNFSYVKGGNEGQGYLSRLKSAGPRWQAAADRLDGDTRRAVHKRIREAGGEEVGFSDSGFADADGLTPQTDTPAFKRWFGASKVVDENGEPLRVYHGTNQVFDEFLKEKRGGATDAPSARLGFFFASNQAVARSYAEDGEGGVERILNKLSGGLFGRAARAIDRRFFGRSPQVMPLFLSIKNPLEVDHKGLEYREESYRETIDRAIADGHDGVVFRNTFDEGFAEGGNVLTDVWVAFEPTQIKSATGNSGAFDPDNPVIFADARGADEDGFTPGPAQNDHTHLGEWKTDADEPIGRQAQDYVLRRGKADGVEYIVALDESGQTLAHGRGVADNTGTPPGLFEAMADPARSIVVHHNHPSNASFSIPDITNLALPGLKAVWAHGHGGAVARAEITPAARAVFAGATGRAKLANVVKAARWPIRDSLQDAIDRGLVSRADANIYLSHMMSLALHRAGIIDYTASVDMSGAAKIVDVEALTHIGTTDALHRVREFDANFEAVSKRVPRRAVRLRHVGDVGAVLDESAGTAGGGRAEGGARGSGAGGNPPEEGFADPAGLNGGTPEDREAIEAFRKFLNRPSADLNAAAIALLENNGNYGGEGFSSVVGRRKVITGLAHAELNEMMAEFERTFVSGKTPNRARLENIVRELFGENSGDAAAKALAASWTKTSENLRTRYNAAGGMIGKLDKWGMPQLHSARLILKDQKGPWKAFIRDRLDLNKMRHPAHGQRMTSAELDEMLDAAYGDIITGGWASREPEVSGSPTKALANKNAEHRHLIFKNADAWLEYQEKYGEANPFAAMMGHVDSMARDIAALEILGPNPDAMVEYLKQVVTKAGRMEGSRKAVTNAERAARTLNGMWRHESGYMQNPAISRLGEFSAMTRNILVAAKLGTAFISALTSDPIMQMIARRFVGLPAAKTFFQVFKAFTPADKRKAVRAGLILPSAQNVLGDQARYLGTMTGIAKWLPDRVLTWTFLTPYTQAGQHAFGLEFLGGVADAAHLPWRELGGENGPLQRAMTRFGITEADWDVIRATPLHDSEGLAIIRPPDVAKIDRRVAEKLLEMVLQETEHAVPQGTLRGRVALIGTELPGTFFGEIRRSAAMFKSFAVTYLMLHGARTAAEYHRGGIPTAAKYAATLAITTTLGGMAGIWLKDLVAGRDPRPILDEDGKPYAFMGQAFMQGGGLGILGDFLVADLNRYGGGLAETLAGPLVQTYNSARNLLQGNLVQLGMGEESNVWKEALAFANSIAPTTVWYLRAAWQRVIMDNLERMTDPNAERSFRRQVQYWENNYNTGFWWEPGQNAPSRGPEFQPFPR